MMNRVEEIQQQIRNLKDELSSIQETCCHPPGYVRYKYKSSTGNWDRSDDCYWTEVRCTLCDKRWTVEGSARFAAPAVQVNREEAL